MNIEFLNVSKKYKSKQALDNITLSLNNGVYGLLGANGAGKTTLINIFVGILKSDQGDIIVNGTNVKDMGLNFLTHIGYLPQYPRFYKDFKVYDFLLYISALKEIPKEEAVKRSKNLIDIVNLGDVAYQKIGALSGGMRQRVGIAQAMLNNPDILILDEPTAGLDPQERIRFRNLITKFSENRIVLLATHIVSDVEFIANQVILLKEGRLIKQNSPEALMNEIDGKVWLVSTTDKMIREDNTHMKISNMYRENGNVQLRVIDDHKPHSSAVYVSPNLEDVFLYYNAEE